MTSQFTAIYEKGGKYYIGYCLEVSGANGQGETLEECRESLREAIKLILEDRVEDAKHSLYINPANGVVETVPRHVEIDNRLAKRICNRFGIPEP